MARRTLRRVAWAGAGWLGLCAIGAGVSSSPPVAVLPPPGAGPEARLLCASLPTVLRYLAVHCWFIVRADTGWDRWEVWQDADAGGRAWGHVHRNLLGPLEGVGDGPPLEYAALSGPEAAAFAACLKSASPRYADRETYRAWPGPNSNTYVDTLLRACGWQVALPATAVGKDWRGFIGGSGTTQGTGFQLESPLVGARIGLHEGVQLHVLALTLGLDFWPPAVELPFGGGRFGFADW